MEAFTVLPRLGGQPPPPPPPLSPRVAPRFCQQKESSAFVVLAEVGTGAPPSGRASPFRGRGFRGPTTSRIPVKSAPSSPGPRVARPAAFGKSAPSSPSKPIPAKRVTALKQPASPRKAATRPAPRPRVMQKIAGKEDRTKSTVKKQGDGDNKTVSKKNDNGDRASSNLKLNESADKVTKNPSETDVRKVKQLNRNNSVSNDALEKSSTTNSSAANGTTTRLGKAGVGKLAVTMDRVNRLRPDKQTINSTRPVKRNSMRAKNETTEGNTKVEKKGSTTTESQRVGKSKLITSENRTVKSVNNGSDNMTIGSDVAATNSTRESKQDETKSPIEAKTTETNQTASSVPDNNYSTLKPSITNGNVASSANIVTLSSGNTTSPGENEDSLNSSQSSSQLTLVTGTTKANVEPVKDTVNIPEKSVKPNDANIYDNKEDNRLANGKLGDGSGKVGEGPILLGAVEKDTLNPKAESTPNGDVSMKNGFHLPNGGEILQNKIIIHQSDKNGPVKVIGSEPVHGEIEEVIKDSIVTETIVPSQEVLLRKEVQPDLIPSGQVEEPAVTVIGQPDVEVEAGNHTVTFSSPEIHPVSARYNKRRNLKELCGCCRPVKRSKGCSWRLPWFQKRNGPGPPPPPPLKLKKKRLSLSSLFSCGKCKGKCSRKKEPKPFPTTKVVSETKQNAEVSAGTKSQTQTKERNLCRRMFCCCCKKNEPAPAQPAGPKKKSYLMKLLCCCCSGRKSSVRPRPQPSQELSKNRRKELSKSRTTSIQSGFSKLEQSLVEHSSMMRAAIPVLPICLAWTCLLLNVFLPGTGTMTSGILCLCFGKPRFSVNDTPIARFGAFFVNMFIGVGQIFTIIFCLVGWGWSIWWGVIMLRLARKHRRIKIAEKNANQPLAVNQNHDAERGR